MVNPGELPRSKAQIVNILKQVAINPTPPSEAALDLAADKLADVLIAAVITEYVGRGE